MILITRKDLRFCATSSWVSKFPRCTNYHLLNYTSDHNPMLLVFGTNHDFMDDSHAKTSIKRFENIWIQDPACLQVIKDIWTQDNEETKAKLQSVLDKVYHWGTTTYGHIPKEIKSTQAKILDLKAQPPDRDNINQIKQLETKMEDLLFKEEQWWAQRAKAHWLQHGDKNSKFFHFKVTQRQRKNKINFIRDIHGTNQTHNKDIQLVFQTYFTKISTSSNPTNMQKTINIVANRVQPQMQDYLSEDFTAAEVSFATHQLKSNAAPGPDGLNAKFYQAYWDTIGGEITQTV
ncbi:hypothetical protein A2U01_0006693, partial [Trifolium medium]|nr:hypothetical protein [Trifolium medium]